MIICLHCGLGLIGLDLNLHWKLGQLTPSFGSILAIWLKKYFFRNKTFLFFKIESWNFQNLFEIEFRETSQNFNSFSLFRQLLIFVFSIVCLIELKFCEVSRNSFSNRFWKFLLSIILEKVLFLKKTFNLLSISKQKSFVYRLNFQWRFWLILHEIFFAIL